MRAILAAALLWTAPATAQVDCTDRANLPQIDLTQCAVQDAEFWDRLLNDAYQQVIARQDNAAEERLRQAQRAWITYRDLTCEMESARYAGGSIAPVFRHTCVARLTERRARDLETYLRP